MKLNQILAIEKGTKASSNRALTDLHKTSQVSALYEGRERTYTPSNDDGEKFPPESQKIQLRSRNVLKDVQTALAELFDITFTKDKANVKAVADIVVDGRVLAKDVPVTYLLFLEKQLTDLHTFLVKLPVLDAAQNWTWSPGVSAYSTLPVGSAKTKKTTKPVVLYEATKEHPAQVKEVSEDVVVGYWHTIQHSAALAQDSKDALVERVTKLQNAIKIAREEANSTDAKRETISGSLFAYVFGDPTAA